MTLRDRIMTAGCDVQTSIPESQSGDVKDYKNKYKNVSNLVYYSVRNCDLQKITCLQMKCVSAQEAELPLDQKERASMKGTKEVA
jgi:hypothetical protein